VGDRVAKAHARPLTEALHTPVPQTPASGRRTSGTEWKHGVWVG